MLVLDFYKSGNARPDSILELEANEYPKHEINKKSMEISTKILKSTYKICKNKAKIKKKSYIFTFWQSCNFIWDIFGIIEYKVWLYFSYLSIYA